MTNKRTAMKSTRKRIACTYLSDGALDVSDDRSVWVVKKLYSYLCHVTSVTSTTKNLVHFSEFDWLILEIK